MLTRWTNEFELAQGRGRGLAIAGVVLSSLSLISLVGMLL